MTFIEVWARIQWECNIYMESGIEEINISMIRSISSVNLILFVLFVFKWPKIKISILCSVVPSWINFTAHFLSAYET